jgi:hypothetical protein
VSKKRFIVINATWGNDDVLGSIKVSRLRWKKILSGEYYDTTSYSYYEGKRSIVNWVFDNKELNIYSDDGVEHLIGFSVQNLVTNLSD